MIHLDKKDKLSKANKSAKMASFNQLKSIMLFLEKNYPKTFNFKNPLPLTVGIFQELLSKVYFDTSLDVPFDKIGLRKFLVYYTDRKPYLKAIVKEKWRYDLNGDMVEEITQDQKDYALKHLEFIKSIWLKIYRAKKKK